MIDLAPEIRDPLLKRWRQRLDRTPAYLAGAARSTVAALDSQVEAAALRRRNEALEAALRWCGGSADFAHGGRSREGWLSGCLPLLLGSWEGNWGPLPDRELRKRLAFAMGSLKAAQADVHSERARGHKGRAEEVALNRAIDEVLAAHRVCWGDWR